jgi:subtilisin family serine protease
MEGRRRPVIALLDTGVGEHPWLPDDIVDRNPECAGLPIGITDPLTHPESPGVTINPLVGGLDPTAGHGTFIAGLIRQTCPDADILAVRVIQGDGIVCEADLLEALNMLWLRQKLAIVRDEPEHLIDILSMSLGYYHGEISDAQFDPFLIAPLRALAQLGVSIVTSAGNDATTRPMYPAAFSPWSGGLIRDFGADEVPIIAVGALNPDGSVALFSNFGPWVKAYRPGVSLVSTLPAFDASHAPTVELDHGGFRRSTVDPDDFSSGFGLWSGTSFAAPILVGEIAQHLNTVDTLPPDDVAPAAAVTRSWAALRRLVPDVRRPGDSEDGS